MKVTLEKVFPMPASADTAWSLLQDIERVALCMPGARITERIDPQRYKGTVAVKFGPASMAFRGDVDVRAVDAATKTLRLIGKGTDTTGSSGASMDLTARVEAVDADSCNLAGTSEVTMSGKAATFGGRLMGSVAEQLLKQFAANFATQARALQEELKTRADTPPTPQSATTTAASEADATNATDAPIAAAAPTAPMTPTTPMTAPAPAADAPSPASGPIPPAAAPPPPQLDGLALAWAILRDWLRTIFPAKRT